MVFESIVVDLLNKFLGDYVQNLDSSQLNLSIWKGNVTLKDLTLKESALQELNLPIRTISGSLGKLILSIPWTNLYNAPVIAQIEQLHLLAAPKSVKYDAAKEEKYQQEVKEKILHQIEAARLRKISQPDSSTQSKDQATFVERLSFQIIKNIQVKIRSIHIRYEDTVSHPGNPFCMGVTLENLSLESTNANWEIGTASESTKFIHKLMKLDSLAFYFQDNCHQYNMREEQWIKGQMMEDIATKDKQPFMDAYLLKPINSTAKLQLNPKPEFDGSDYTIPKVLLHLMIEEIGLMVFKRQYQDFLFLLDGLSRLQRGLPYCRFRPDVPSYKGYAKEWWQFAIQSVLYRIHKREESFTWAHISAHRRRCRAYRNAYCKVLTVKKPSAELLAEVAKLEKELDVFNISLLRRSAELETEKIQKEMEEKKKKKPQGWFGWMWGGGGGEQQPQSTEDYSRRLAEAMTSEEKAKLYEAIGYEEGMTVAEYPASYVERKIEIRLGEAQFSILDNDQPVKLISKFCFCNVVLGLEQRPSADGLQVDFNCTKMLAVGWARSSMEPPMLIQDQVREDVSAVFHAQFSMNPLDKKCNYYIQASAEPLEVIFDSPTVTQLLDVFQTPASLVLDDIQAAARGTFEEIKHYSLLGMQQTITERPIIDIDIHLKPSHLVLPEHGVFSSKSHVLVVSLGALDMRTILRDQEVANVNAMLQSGSTKEEILSHMLKESVDKFELKISQIQALVAHASENWLGALHGESQGLDSPSPLHILLPMRVEVGIHLSIRSADVRLPKAKIMVHLPRVGVTLTHKKLITTLRLLLTMEWGQTSSTKLSVPAVTGVEKKSILSADVMSESVIHTTDILNLNDNIFKLPAPLTVEEEIGKVQFTSLQVEAKIEEISMRLEETSFSYLPPLHFLIKDVGASMIKRETDMVLTFNLGGLLFESLGSSQVIILQTSLKSGMEKDGLFNLQYLMADEKSPQFEELYKSIAQQINMKVSSLDIVLQKALCLAMMKYGNDVFEELKPLMTKRAGSEHDLHQTETGMHRHASSLFLHQISKPRGSPRLGRKKRDVIQLRVEASLGHLGLTVSRTRGPLCEISIAGLRASFQMTEEHMIVQAQMKDFLMLDPSPHALYSKMVHIVGDDAFKLSVQMFSNAASNRASDPSAVDMDIRGSIGGVHVVYLHQTIMDILEFINHFQAAKDAVIEASAAAAEAARANVTKAYQQAFCIRFAVDMKAPVIVIPRSYASREVFLADMGTLKLDNHFEVIPSQSKSKPPLVFDHLNITLRDFKFSRQLLSEESLDILAEVLLIEPISFKFLLKRNLSLGSYLQYPQNDISANLGSIRVCLSEGDYKFTLAVLQENLGGGAQGSRKEVPASPSSPVPGHIMTQSFLPGSISIPSAGFALKEEKLSATAPREEQDYTALQIGIQLDSVELVLYSGSSNLVGQKLMTGQKVVERNPKQSLARCSLSILALNANMSSNGEVEAKLVLVNCIVDDERGTHSGITRLMERKGPLTKLVDQIMMEEEGNKGKGLEESKEKKEEKGMEKKIPLADVKKLQSMVEFKLKQDCNGNLDIECKVFSFLLVFDVDFLMVLKDFVTVPPKQDSPFGTPGVLSPASSMSTESFLPLQGSQGVAEAQGHGIKVTLSAVEDKEVAKPITTMKIKLIVEEPDIAVVVDMRKMDTNALMMHMKCEMEYRASSDHLMMTGNITDFRMYSCCYNLEKRLKTSSEVLRPTSLFVTMNSHPDKDMRIDVNMGELILRVTPQIIQIMMTIWTNLISPSQAIEENPQALQLPSFTGIWEQKAITERDHWFLRPEEEGVEVEKLQAQVLREKVVVLEQLVMEAKTIILTLEVDSAGQSSPLMLFESSFVGEVNNWSSELQVSSSMSLEMAYYNSILSLWEPLLEPVETTIDQKTSYIPWDLNLEIQANTLIDALDEVDSGEASLLPPEFVINILSNSVMNLTLTRTSLQVMSQLSEEFQKALEQKLYHKQTIEAPFLIHNYLGVDVTYILAESDLVLFEEQVSSVKEVVLKPGAIVGLKKAQNKEKVQTVSILRDQDSREQMFLTLQMEGYKGKFQVPVLRSDTRFFPMISETNGFISQVSSEEGLLKTIILRSPVQVINQFDQPVEVFYMTKQGNEVARIGVVEPLATLNLPLDAVYTPTAELFFRVNGYTVSDKPFVWRDLRREPTISHILQCKPSGSIDMHKKSPFYLNVMGELIQVYHGNTTRKTLSSASFRITLLPMVKLRNLLPYPIHFQVQDPGQAPPKEMSGLGIGESIILTAAEPGASLLTIQLASYLTGTWECKERIEKEPPELGKWAFSCPSAEGGQTLNLYLGMYAQQENGSLFLSLYSPFWMLNKTHLSLTYMGDEALNVFYHDADTDKPILFSFHKFFAKKKAQLRVADSEWSDRFPIDTVGSSGVVKCSTRKGCTYQVGIQISMGCQGLTKKVIFLPFYMMKNTATYAIEFKEQDLSQWYTLEPGASVPIWPEGKETSEGPRLILRVKGASGESQSFSIKDSHTTMLKLNNQYGGIQVDVATGESFCLITLSPYISGLAPALIVNHLSEYTIEYRQEGLKKSTDLPPRYQRLYTWDDPKAIHSRKVAWSVGGHGGVCNIMKEGLGKFSLEGGREAYWVSFLDGLQRVLLFTEESDLVTRAQMVYELERRQMSVEVKLFGIGLSLVDNLQRKEVFYAGITSSDVSWEIQRKGRKRYRPLAQKDSRLLEEGFRRYSMETEARDSVNPVRTLTNGYKVDYSKLVLLPESSVTGNLKRNFETGLWLQYATSPHQLHFHMRLRRLQIDSQLQDSVFPVVLEPIPPPKSVAAEGTKPFVELSLLQRRNEESPIMHIRYCKILIQEFHVKVDLTFINSLLSVLLDDKRSKRDEFGKDMEDMVKPAEELLALQGSSQVKIFFDLLHFSPLKMHLSFSLSGAAQHGEGLAVLYSGVINLLLQGVGITLTDVQDVVFRLAYFERQSRFINPTQLSQEVFSHYLGQFMKQLYVLVLGLDVIGNPFALVTGLTQGVEALFYEPFQGAIQGPEEFAEGLILGVQRMVGHTVGGAAGAVSRITGTFGKGLAALSLDKEFQKERLEQQQRQRHHATIAAGMAHNIQGFGRGVFEGVTGVFTKPMEGARSEGIGGFFKGMGKGVVGLVTRPTTGLVDFASGSFDVIKRASEGAEAITRLRPPRFLHPDGVIRPYVRFEASGSHLFMEIEKGKYTSTDMYICHVPARADGKQVAIVTDQRVMMIQRSDIFGQWEVQWAHTWGDLIKPPTLVDKGIELLIKSGKSGKKVLGLFSSSGDVTRLITIPNRHTAQWILAKMEDARCSSAS